MADLDFTIQVDDQELVAALQAMLGRARDTSPLMQDIARVLRNRTEDAFQHETSPFGGRWQDLTEETKRRRAKDGHWPGSILQVSGQLAASLSSRAGPDYAEIGVGKGVGKKGYGAIHQFGGLPNMAPGPAAIPMRSFLPISRSGELPDDVRRELLDLVEDFFRSGR